MTDYLAFFTDRHVAADERYPHNDIGISTLFYDFHRDTICFVVEAKMWYCYTGKRWEKDDGGLQVMEICKDFVQALVTYAMTLDNGSEKSAAYIKYTAGFHTRRKREGLLSDARSIAPKNLSDFDRDKLLFNCQNGTFSLFELVLRPHRPEDYITKIARVHYRGEATCERWERFIDEIMCDDIDTAHFLQKSLGYCLSGETNLECFFILYGGTTRNGKTTLTETIGYIFGDYSRTIQPQTLSRRSTDGASPSPDTARLKGARLVNMPEPEKGLELNISLVKQLTGGDTYTARFLNENPVEFAPEFKIIVNTNHLPRTSDDTVFSSGRIKLIPFERHFTPEEQDTRLKNLFREEKNMSGIFSWLIEGYRLLTSEGLSLPDKVKKAIGDYRQEADIIGSFLCECTIIEDGSRIATSELYNVYTLWAKENGYRPMNNKNFVAELRRRFDVRRGSAGNVVLGLSLDYIENPFIK